MEPHRKRMQRIRKAEFSWAGRRAGDLAVLECAGWKNQYERTEARSESLLSAQCVSLKKASVPYRSSSFNLSRFRRGS